MQAGRKFAHPPPDHDGSLHLTLPPGMDRGVENKGWGNPHPVSPSTMVDGLRDENELEFVWQLLLISYRFARDNGGSFLHSLGVRGDVLIDSLKGVYGRLGVVTTTPQTHALRKEKRWQKTSRTRRAWVA